MLPTKRDRTLLLSVPEMKFLREDNPETLHEQGKLDQSAVKNLKDIVKVMQRTKVKEAPASMNMVQLRLDYHPVARRLSKHLINWKLITRDQWC